MAIGGGEPLQHPHLFAFMRESVRRNITPSLSTNGSRLGWRHLPFLKKYAGAVALSIEKIGEGFEEIRHFPFVKFVEAAEKISKAGIRLVFQITIGRNNIKEIEGLVSYLLRFRPYGIIFLSFKPVGRGFGYDQSFSKNESAALRKTLRKIIEINPAQKFGYDCCLAASLYGEDSRKGEFFGCSAVRSSIAVNASLDAVPCSFSKLKLGNLKKMSLPDIWSGEAAQNFRRKISDKLDSMPCLNCADKTACVGGCPELPISFCHKEVDCANN
jgi:radical SAM protein with 4Fe4S-binding SPASM domain